MLPILIALIALVAVAIVVVALGRRRSGDGVDSFRRQIDALSPEARRPVVNQVQRFDPRHPLAPQGDEPVDEAVTPDASSDTSTGEDPTGDEAQDDEAQDDEAADAETPPDETRNDGGSTDGT